MGISALITSLAAMQATLEITDPVALKVKRVYDTIPDAKVILETPCWINTWTFLPEIRGGGLRETQFDIRMQLFCYDSSQAKASLIAAAFFEKILDAIDTNNTLGGLTNGNDFSGGDPTLVGLTWNLRSYVGLDLHFMAKVKEAFNFSG